MLRDITIGQYFPTESPVHQLDPRVKLMGTIWFVTLLFSASHFWGMILCASLLLVMVFLSKVPFKYMLRGLRPVLLIIVFSAVINLFFTAGTPVVDLGWARITWEGIRMAIKMSARLALLILGSSLLTFTTTPISLTDGVERLLQPFKRLGLPAHELAMMMTIALRFIPTLLEETDKIMKAQMARGARLDSGSLIERARNLVPILVPLFVGAFRRADELAMAMEARCYRGGENRTRLKTLKFTRRDLWATLFILISTLIVLSSQWLPTPLLPIG